MRIILHRILITDDIGPEGLALLDAATDIHYDVVRLPSREELITVIGDYDAVITRSGTSLDGDTFVAAKKLRVAGRAGMGVDNVNLDAATLRGGLVMNAPEANSLAIVELTVALLLAVCRQLPAATDSLKRGAWTGSQFLGAQLSGKTLGIIGLGRIGSRVATRCQALGMKVIAYDPYIAEEVADRLHVYLVGELLELLDHPRAGVTQEPSPETNQGVRQEFLKDLSGRELSPNSAAVAGLSALAIRFDQLLQDGRVRKQAELAKLRRVTRARVSQIVGLLNRAPDIAQAVLFLVCENERERVMERSLRVIAGELDWPASGRSGQERERER